MKRLTSIILTLALGTGALLTGCQWLDGLKESPQLSRARKEAVANLTSLLGGLTGKTVIVDDPSPEGYLNQ